MKLSIFASDKKIENFVSKNVFKNAKLYQIAEKQAVFSVAITGEQGSETKIKTFSFSNCENVGSLCSILSQILSRAKEESINGVKVLALENPCFQVFCGDELVWSVELTR